MSDPAADSAQHCTGPWSLSPDSGLAARQRTSIMTVSCEPVDSGQLVSVMSGYVLIVWQQSDERCGLGEMLCGGEVQ